MNVSSAASGFCLFFEICYICFLKKKKPLRFFKCFVYCCLRRRKYDVQYTDMNVGEKKTVRNTSNHANTRWRREKKRMNTSIKQIICRYRLKWFFVLGSFFSYFLSLSFLFLITNHRNNMIILREITLKLKNKKKCYWNLTLQFIITWVIFDDWFSLYIPNCSNLLYFFFSLL